ncbi:hypothetical protein DPMN_163372 [Dreissena polymorpha]|uniref:Uncharacterized protein n=1 Tax=Dreissena polymorpha TaxID=45954 RepID=A0A9D4IUI6_DREPO|nr:hypothetical protein DPMN_163372 [Dreissena polymorpha]
MSHTEGNQTRQGVHILAATHVSPYPGAITVTNTIRKFISESDHLPHIRTTKQETRPPQTPEAQPKTILVPYPFTQSSAGHISCKRENRENTDSSSTFQEHLCTPVTVLYVSPEVYLWVYQAFTNNIFIMQNLAPL